MREYNIHINVSYINVRRVEQRSDKKGIIGRMTREFPSYFPLYQKGRAPFKALLQSLTKP